MPLVQIDALTKDYGMDRGVFGVSLAIERGEVFGFVGTNGAGKTTVIRHLMGFLKPDKGSCAIDGMDCWQEAAAIKRLVGYVPGEIAFPDEPTGTAFFKRQAELLHVTDLSYARRLTEILQLDPTANLKRMSKGMKQKTAIIAAFMADPPILILDEPTTGLDPLMRAGFVDILLEEKKKGKTIFMSSHMFEEVEETCDRVALIKNGRILTTVDTEDIRHHQEKTYKIEFRSQEAYRRFIGNPFRFAEKRDDRNQIVVVVADRDINGFLRVLKDYPVKFLTEIKYSLETSFREMYKEDNDVQ